MNSHQRRLKLRKLIRKWEARRIEAERLDRELGPLTCIHVDVERGSVTYARVKPEDLSAFQAEFACKVKLVNPDDAQHYEPLT